MAFSSIVESRVMFPWLAIPATPLIKKLGIKPGFNITLIGAPAGYANTLDLPPDVTINSRPGKPLDFAQLFVKSEKELATKFTQSAERLNASGMLWVSWPKKSFRRVDQPYREHRP